MRVVEGILVVDVLMSWIGLLKGSDFFVDGGGEAVVVGTIPTSTSTFAAPPLVEKVKELE